MSLHQEVLSGWTREKSNLIPLLQKVQEHEGYLSEGALSGISSFLGMSKSEVYGVATFYAQFRFIPPAKHKIKVCLGTACHVRGGEKILDATKRELKLSETDTTDDYEFSVERVACIGCCALAPCAVIDDNVYANLTASKIPDILQEVRNET